MASNDPRFQSDPFQLLPLELILKIFFNLESFSQIVSTILISRTFYNVFKHYQSMILVRISRNVVGYSASIYSLKALVYQRYEDGTLTGLAVRMCMKYKSEVKLIFTPRDMKRLMLNEIYYDRCKVALIGSGFGHIRAEEVTKAVIAYTRDGVTAPVSCWAHQDHFLTMKDYFYQFFLLAYQYGFDSIEQFSRRAEIDRASRAKLLHVGLVMRMTPMEQDPQVPYRRVQSWPGSLRINTVYLVSGLRKMIHSPAKNPLLLAKILAEYNVIYRDFDRVSDLGPKLSEVEKQYNACSESGKGMDSLLDNYHNELNALAPDRYYLPGI